VTPIPTDDPTQAFQKAERRLRELLFGDGTFTPGMVKGEERRMETTKILRRMREAFDQAAAAAAAGSRGRVAQDAQARIADLEDELRRLAAARTGERSDFDR
jgi:hypothetical protein